MSVGVLRHSIWNIFTNLKNILMIRSLVMIGNQYFVMFSNDDFIFIKCHRSCLRIQIMPVKH